MPSNFPHIHGVLDLSQSGSVSPLNVMPLTQWQHGTPSSSEGSVAPLYSVQGAVGQSLSAQQTPELSTSKQGTLILFLDQVIWQLPHLLRFIKDICHLWMWICGHIYILRNLQDI